MQFTTELHIHTSDVSKCSHVSPEEMVELYIQKGYSTIVITNHYSEFNFTRLGISSWDERNEVFISAYKNSKKAAKGRISVLFGMEYRSNHSPNDYLIYGMTEEFIRTHCCDDEHNILSMHLKDLTKLVHDNNMLFFQAHPFRDGMKIVNPSYLDGIEAYNCHPRHDSRNDIAENWAKKYNMLVCGGSDCHEKDEEAQVALLSDAIITDNDKLLNVLKNSPEFEFFGAK